MYHLKVEPKVTVRSVFIIDLQHKIRTTLTCLPSAERNIHDILHTIDALPVTDEQLVATPVNWKSGDEVVISPARSDVDTQQKFRGFRKVKPYLRYNTASSKA